MPRFLPYVMRSILRNKVRTTLTVFGLMVAVGIFCFLTSIETSMDTTIDRAAQSSLLVVTQKDQWWPTASRLPDQLGLEKSIERMPRVKRAMAVYIKTNGWGKSGGLVKIEGVDKDKFLDFIPLTLDEATLETFRKTPDGALLGKDFVERYKDKYPWKIGQSYMLRELGGISITFVGSYESANEVYNTIILTGRRFIEEVDDRLGVAHQVYVKIDDPERAGEVIAAIDKQVPEEFPYAVTTKDQRAFMSAAVADLRETVDFSRWILLITLGVILVSVANTVSMATRDRVQEFGVVRALGFRRIQVLGLVLTESVILSLVGGGLGILAATLLLNLQDYYYGVLGLNLLIEVTAPVAVAALVVSLGVGVLGGLLPAIGASRLRIVNSLRNVD